METLWRIIESRYRRDPTNVSPILNCALFYGFGVNHDALPFVVDRIDTAGPAPSLAGMECIGMSVERKAWVAFLMDDFHRLPALVIAFGGYPNLVSANIDPCWITTDDHCEKVFQPVWRIHLMALAQYLCNR
jgi:hypothetical protein